MHDNHGEQDEHLGFGKGNIPLTEVCQFLEQYSPDAIWAIETNTKDIEQSILWLHEYGYRNERV